MRWVDMRFVPLILALALAPLLRGIINRTKARFAGRAGPPLLQAYYDLSKLLRKGAVYSHTTTWVFRAGPIVSLSGVLVAATLLPFGNCPSAVAFPGDLVVFVYLLAVGRFFTVAAALDTGSAFEGMGSSREVFFSALAEPSLLLGMAAVARESIGGSAFTSLSEILSAASGHLWVNLGLILVFVAVALFVVCLAENARMPVDDPTTHLELTMIHEVMVLDHGGPDFALVNYAAALKLWLTAALIVGIVVPSTHLLVVDVAVSLSAMAFLAVLIGAVESTMARLRMVRVQQLLIGAATLTFLALILEYRA
ncbi:MAG: NADH-quinone oxidoreductase subunit H [Pirellulales bacterium]